MESPLPSGTFIQEDPPSREHIHGDHWRPFVPESLDRENISKLMDKASEGAVLFHARQHYLPSDSAVETAYPKGAMLGTPHAELGAALLVRADPDARQGESHSMEIVSVYPTVNGSDTHPVTLRRVHVWPNRLEGQVTGDVDGCQLSFFDTHYCLNRPYYAPDATLPFHLYGIALRLAVALEPPFLVPSGQGGSFFGVRLIDQEFAPPGPDEECPEGKTRCLRYFQPEPELRHLERDFADAVGPLIDRDQYACFARVVAVEPLEQTLADSPVTKIRVAFPLLNGAPFECWLYCGHHAWTDENRPTPGQHVYGSFWLCGYLSTPSGEPHAEPANADQPQLPQPPDDWLIRHACQGATWAQLALWDRLRLSDFDAAMDWLKQAAEGGLAEARHRLARQLEKDGKARQALAWHRRAATSGNEDSALEVGLAYAREMGLKANPHLAIRWLKKAPNRASALLWLGVLHDDFDGVKPDPGKARTYYQAAARFDEPEALACLGEMELEQLGEENAGLEHLLRAARLGHEPARARIGLQVASMTGPDAPLPATSEVKEWLSQCEGKLRGYALSLLVMICLGRVDRHRREQCPPDMVRARNALAELIQSGNEWAICYQAYLPLLGLDGIPDPELSIHEMRALFRKRPALGPEYRAWLYLVLGYLAERGIGMPPNIDRALRDYRQSSRLGQTTAAYLRARLLMTQGEARRRRHSAFVARCKAEIQADWRSNEDLQWLMGMMHRDGIGMAADPVRAAAWFEIAAENQCVMARYDLERLRDKLSEEQAREAQRQAQAICEAPREARLFDEA